MITNAGNAAVEAGIQPPLDPQTEVLARDLEKIWTDYSSLKQSVEALARRPEMPPDLIRELNRGTADFLADAILDTLKAHVAGPGKKPESQPSGPSAEPAGAGSSPDAAGKPAGSGPEAAQAKAKPSRQLSRVEYDKMLAGVCGGLAEYFHIDSSLVRVAFILTALPPFVFVGLIAYVILAILLPLKLTPDEG